MEVIIMDTDKTFAEALASEYAPKDTSKVLALKKLDRRAKMPATIFTYTFGICAALIMGLGMCLCMQVIGSGSTMMVLGIILGVAGITAMSINYPIYKKMLEKGKSQYAFEITQLAKEIVDAAE